MNPSDEEAEKIPSRGWAKLDAGIIFSTLWMQADDVLRAWIALLSMADAKGRVRASVPGLAHVCLSGVERMREILEIFKAPDPDSRIKADEGRKIREIEGGWLIINYTKYRNELMQRKPSSGAERQARWRKRKALRDKNRNDDRDV